MLRDQRSGPTLPDPLRKALDETVDSFLREQGPGIVSIWYGGLDGRPSYARDEYETHYAASTMKLPLVVAAYRRHERGELDLDEEVDVHNEFASAVDGSPFRLDRSEDQDEETWDLLGSRAPLRWLATHAIVKSGNLATNLLLEHVGAGELSSVLDDAGCTSDTVLVRGIEDARAREAGLDNRVTANDLALVMAGVAARVLAGEQTCAAVEQVVAGQEHRDKIPAGLPAGTYVANKTGWVDGVAHDVALVRPHDATPYVLVVCTTVDVPETTAAALIAEVSRRIWEGRGA